MFKRLFRRINNFLQSDGLGNPPRKSSPEPRINWTEALHEALRGATRLHVHSDGYAPIENVEEKTLLDVRDTEEIAAVIERIEIDDDSSGYQCTFFDGPTLEFYHDDKRTTILAIQHGARFFWPDGKWKGDGVLTPESAFSIAQWLASHGVDGPLKKAVTNLHYHNEYVKARKRWLEAMPQSLLHFWSKMEARSISENYRLIYDTLVNEYPNESERILALLHWFGSGTGRMAYEAYAEELLLNHKTAAILEAINSVELTETQIEGTARFFCGWRFKENRSENLDLLPDDLKQQLFEHCQFSTDEHLRERAQALFQ